MAGEGGYRRRAPEQSALYGAFREAWPTYAGKVPKRVMSQVQRYLECGQLRYGFVEVRCEECRVLSLVAFSCKGRGLCPSCTSRRAIEVGAHVEALLSKVAHRQWTLSLPRALRLSVVRRPEFFKQVEPLLVQAVWRWQRQQARWLGVDGELSGGAVVQAQYTLHARTFGEDVWLCPCGGRRRVLAVVTSTRRRSPRGLPIDEAGGELIRYVQKVAQGTYMAKLTLSVDEKVVRRAKRFAAGQGTSVSELVERYLDAVTRPETETEETPVLSRLRGTLRGSTLEQYPRHLERKYR